MFEDMLMNALDQPGAVSTLPFSDQLDYNAHMELPA
jgi:hypothetical protein